MSDTHAHQEHAAATHGPYFSDAEWQSLQASDRSAARAVVALLLGVFCTGIVLYSIVVWAVTS